MSNCTLVVARDPYDIATEDPHPSIELEVDLLDASSLQRLMDVTRLAPSSVSPDRVIVIRRLDRCDRRLQRRIKSLLDVDARCERPRRFAFIVERTGTIDPSIVSRCRIVRVPTTESAHLVPPVAFRECLLRFFKGPGLASGAQRLASDSLKFHIPMAWTMRWTVAILVHAYDDATARAAAGFAAACDVDACAGGYRLKLQYLCLERFFLSVHQHIYTYEVRLHGPG